MKFGVQVNCYRTTWDDIRATIETLEAGRWHSLWFADHFLPPPGRRDEEHLPAFEGFTLIAVAAGMTRELRLGHLVLGNTYRNPALVARWPLRWIKRRKVDSSWLSVQPGSSASTRPTAGISLR